MKREIGVASVVMWLLYRTVMVKSMLSTKIPSFGGSPDPEVDPEQARDYISHLARECLRIPQEELQNVTGELV